MAKIVNISEIHPTLGFTEFDILVGSAIQEGNIIGNYCKLYE